VIWIIIILWLLSLWLVASWMFEEGRRAGRQEGYNEAQAEEAKWHDISTMFKEEG
jgi:hypothetical protein